MVEASDELRVRHRGVFNAVCAKSLVSSLTQRDDVGFAEFLPQLSRVIYVAGVRVRPQFVATAALIANVLQRAEEVVTARRWVRHERWAAR